MGDNPDATVVRDGDDRTRAWGIGGGQEGAGKLFRRMKGNGADAGTGAAQKGSEGSSRFRGGDNAVKCGNEFFPKRLVQMIGEGALELLVLAGSKGGGDRAGVPATLHRLEPVDSRRQNPARLLGCDFEAGDQQNEMQLGRDRKHLAMRTPHDVESAICGGGGVVGMSFQFGANFEKFLPLKRPTRELVQAMENSQPNGGAAAETTGPRDVPLDRAGKGECFAFGEFEKEPGCRTNHCTARAPFAPRDSDMIVNAQGHAEAIEARTEIRGARWNADRNSLHSVSFSGSRSRKQNAERRGIRAA